MSSSSRASPSAERYDRNDGHSSMKRRRLHGDIKLSPSSCFSPCNSSSSSSSSCCVSDNLNHLSNYTQPFQNKCVTGSAKAASSLVESFHHETEASVKSRISLESCDSEAESSVGSSTGSLSVHHRLHRHKLVHHRLHLHHDKDTPKLDEDEVQSRFRGVLIELSAEGHVCGRVSDGTATEGGQELKNARSCQDQHEEQVHGEQEEKIEENHYIDNNSGGGLGFDPNTVFRTTFFSNGDGEDDGNGLLFSCASPDNTSWFLNELDSEGNAFLDEVLDHERMTSAIANLERLNDTVDSCDSCVLHQLQEPWKLT